MLIETKNASLDTMTVTIQALHVGGKQMTLSVFRQLPIAKAFTDSGELRDLEFWGLVRYKIKDEADVWVVASEGGILYRCDAAPQRSSITSMERDEEVSRRELQEYLEWEPMKLAWETWRNIGWPARNEITQPQNPGSTKHGFKVDQEITYRNWLNEATAALARARTLEQSIAKLATLTQLFIAV